MLKIIKLLVFFILFSSQFGCEKEKLKKHLLIEVSDDDHNIISINYDDQDRIIKIIYTINGHVIDIKDIQYLDGKLDKLISHHFESSQHSDTIYFHYNSSDNSIEERWRDDKNVYNISSNQISTIYSINKYNDTTHITSFEYQNNNRVKKTTSGNYIYEYFYGDKKSPTNDWSLENKLMAEILGNVVKDILSIWASNNIEQMIEYSNGKVYYQYYLSEKFDEEGYPTYIQNLHNKRNYNLEYLIIER